MRRNPKQSAASGPSKSAALAPQDAGFPARSGGPDRPPAWIPEDVDFHNMPGRETGTSLIYNQWQLFSPRSDRSASTHGRSPAMRRTPAWHDKMLENVLLIG